MCVYDKYNSLTHNPYPYPKPGFFYLFTIFRKCEKISHLMLYYNVYFEITIAGIDLYSISSKNNDINN